jgi:hypothetical protein
MPASSNARKAGQTAVLVAMFCAAWLVAVEKVMRLVPGVRPLVP